MTMTGTGQEPSSIQTRPSLLNRLKDGDDVESWQEFYRVYGKLARDFAIKAGLTDTEADEVVQETAIGVARTAALQAGLQACGREGCSVV